MMHEKTFSKPEVQAKINDHFSKLAQDKGNEKFRKVQAQRIPLLRLKYKEEAEQQEPLQKNPEMNMVKQIKSKEENNLSLDVQKDIQEGAISVPFFENQDSFPKVKLDDILQRLKQLIEKNLHIPEKDILLDNSFRDMGMDSIGAVEIVRDINENLGLTLDAVTLYDYPNLEAISQFIFQELEAKKTQIKTEKEEVTIKASASLQYKNNQAKKACLRLLYNMILQRIKKKIFI